MGIFHRRYLCIFAFLFLFCSFIATFLSGSLKLMLALILLSFALITVVLVAVNQKRRFAFLVCLCCLAFSGVAIINSYLFISVPKDRAAEYVGEHSVEMEILSQEGSYESSSKYMVKIKQIEGEKVNIRAYLDCDFVTDFSFGDRVIAFANIEEFEHYSAKDGSILLSLTVDETNPVFYKNDVDSYFSLDGIRAAFGGIRNGFVNYIDSLFEGEDAGLVKGMLINEKSGLSSKTISEFRRAGVSHLLAVSGVHVALLLGALEVLLRKLFVPRKVRCVIVAAFGLFFLALTGFAASAIRAVLMLFAVYISFMLYEDSDSVTSLFVAAFLITLFSPYSVYDLGMWMSFFATLGLVTVYPYLDKRLKYEKGKRKTVNLLKRASLSVLKMALITVVANFFLLPIMWYFFGEISLVTIAANLAVSPLSTVFLPFSAVALALGKIAFLGDGLVWLTLAIGRCIMAVTEFFAGFKGAMLSLNFPFVPVLIILFSISFSVMLIIKLKRKLLICIPPIAFSLVFAICLSVFFFTSKTEIKQISYDKNEILMIDRCGSVAVVDDTDGSVFTAKVLKENITPYATEIEHYVILHAGRNHSYSLESILQNMYVRNIYLPLASNKDELSFIEKIYDVALEYGINVVFYSSGERSITHQGVTFTPYFDEKYGWIEINK